LLFAGPAYADSVRQIGAHSSDASDHYATGARSTITEPGPIQLYDAAQFFSWIGSVLSDGSFYQVGYGRHVAGCASNQWFAQGFDPAGNRTLVVQAQCGLTGTHVFSMEYRQTSPDGTSEWISYMDGSALPGSSFFARAQNIGSQTPYAVSELSIAGSTSPNLSDTMPGIRYYPALQVKLGTNPTYYNSLSATVQRQTAPCPPYNAFADGTNNIRAGSGYATTCQNGSLW
jgi:hypothetical protein